MRELIINTDEGGKGRSFKASLLSCATAKSLWSGGDSSNTRPIYAMVACSSAESLPFIRNLQAGRKATIKADQGYSRRGANIFECLKSADYDYKPQAHPEGTVWTIYLPALYRIDAGMVEPDVKFAIMPAALADPDPALVKWIAGRFERPEADMEHVVRIAPLFAAYLNSRSRCPLIPEPRFYALMLASMLAASHACMANREAYSRLPELGRSGIDYHESDGAAGGIVCNVSHERLEPLLAECVRVYERG